MKYLSDYTNDATSELLEKNGAFFAFSDKQFEEAKDPNLNKEDYRHLFGGLIAPKANAETVARGLVDISKRAIAQDLEENGPENIIKRELANHEAYYTGDITSTIKALDGYGITEDQIKEVYREQSKLETNY